jgi:HxlR-like helix-turn-helix
MLSRQLRLLEKCELVKRTVHPQFPPKVEYELTEFGKTLCPAMKTLVDWAMTFPDPRNVPVSTEKGSKSFLVFSRMNDSCAGVRTHDPVTTRRTQLIVKPVAAQLTLRLELRNKNRVSKDGLPIEHIKVWSEISARWTSGFQWINSQTVARD